MQRRRHGSSGRRALRDALLVLVAVAWAVVADVPAATRAAAGTSPPVFVRTVPLDVSMPQGVAASPVTGDIYVVGGEIHPTTAGRVVRLDAAGNYLGEMHNDFAGFHDPHGVAVGPDGSVYVADTGLDRIVRFPATGEQVISVWGHYGSGPGEFNHPYGVAVGPDGSVYVADTGNHRIQKFTPTGTYKTRWGARGTASGRFVSPQGVAVSADRKVYVLDNGNNRVQQFTGTGTFQRLWGGPGSGDGQLSTGVDTRITGGLAVDATGNVFVADRGNNRVQVFTGDGTFLTSFAQARNIGPHGVALSPDGTTVLVTGVVGGLHLFGPGATNQAPPPVFVNAWGSSGSGDGQFGFPYEVATDAAGNVYVTDFGNSRVEKFGSTGSYLAQWSASLSGPIGVAVGPDGSVYVVDYNTATVRRSSATGAPMGQWGGSGVGDGQFSGPFSVAVAADGTVYVTDPGNNRVQYFTAAGGYLGQWGGAGSGNGQFDSPLGVAVGPDGSVYVTDEHNDRVQRFTATGAYVGQWGTAGSGGGQFANPFAVAVDGAGYVYVTDFFNNRVQQFTANGTYRTQWGAAGSGNAQFNGPTGVAVNASGYVYVVDANNSRVQRFAPAAQPTVALSADQAQVSPGDGIDYHLTITNATANTLTGVRVTDAEAPDCEGPVDNLAAGASTTVECTYQTTADDVGPFTNTASVDTDQTVTLTSNTVSTQVGPAVTVTMTAPARVTATASIPYAIGITNNTLSTLTGVRVSDTAVPGCAGPVADIAVGATAAVSCTRTTTDADSGSQVFNAAFVDAPGTQGGFATALTSVRGRVTGTITGPNGPVAGAFVLALARDFLPLQGDTVANGSGVYNLGLDPGRYYLVFMDPSGATMAEYHNNKTSTAQLTTNDLVTVAAGSGPATANATLAQGFLPVANPARIFGVVTDANGPVAGVWVVAINGGVRSATRTNAAGQYVVGNLPAGTSYLEFADPSGTHAFRWYHNDNGANPTGIPLTAGQQLTGINETLPPYP